MYELIHDTYANNLKLAVIKKQGGTWAIWIFELIPNGCNGIETPYGKRMNVSCDLFDMVGWVNQTRYKKI